MLINNRETWAWCTFVCGSATQWSRKHAQAFDAQTETCFKRAMSDVYPLIVRLRVSLLRWNTHQWRVNTVFTGQRLPSLFTVRLSTKPRTATLHPEPIVWIWMATLHENWYEPRGGIPAWQWRASPRTIRQPRTSNACIVYPLPKDARAPLTRVTGDLLSFSGMY